MKAHEGAWLRSESFQKMFLECNPMFLAHLSKFFYGDGAVVKDNCLDLNFHLLGFFFAYTDFNYGRFKKGGAK